MNNTTHSNGIYITRSPGSGNIVKGNPHQGGKAGYLKNQNKANVSGNKNYQAS